MQCRVIAGNLWAFCVGFSRGNGTNIHVPSGNRGPRRGATESSADDGQGGSNPLVDFQVY
jgi:hypothetical protein